MDLFEIRNALANGRSIFDLDLRVTYYARVSTDKDEQLHSLKAQVDYYREYIQSNPGWTYTEGYIDEGISGTSVEKRESFLQMIEDAKSGKFDFIRSERTLFEILPKGVDKSLSLKKISEHLKIDISHTVAIGDYDNDVAMIRAAGLGVAVSNASPSAIAAADLVTVSNDEHAIARVIFDIESRKFGF